MEQTLDNAQTSRAALENLFLESLPEIERVSRFIARRQRLSPSEADDFCSEVKLAIIGTDYAVLAAFQGRSSLRTYLAIVIHRLFLDHRRRQWGKWRPSAEAQRRGPLALRLEILLHRDGLSLDEALETMRTNFGCEESREVLAELAQGLPQRTSRRPVDEAVEGLTGIPAGELASPEVQLEGADTSIRVQGIIDAVMEAVDPQDRLVLRLRFEDDVSVADIARTLHLDQRKLYRRIEEILGGFRKSLEARGLSWSEVSRMIERGQCHLRLPQASEKGGARPSPTEVQA